MAQVLGLALGDAHILRNAGGRVTDDTIRSLVISQQQLGTREIVVLHHTDCGAQSFTNEAFAAQLERDLGVDVHDKDFLPFSDVEESVREDIAILRNSPLIPDDGASKVEPVEDVRNITKLMSSNTVGELMVKDKLSV